MAEYSVVFARSARKEIERLPASVAKRIIERIESLTSVPRPPGSLKLKGNRNLWRIRIGDYRVIYSIDDSDLLIDISAVRHRRDAYFDF